LNTPTHLLIGAGLRRALRARPWPRWAVWLGSVAPDVPLYLLCFGALWYYRQVRGWEGERTARHMFDYLYFHDPWWLGLHNLLHSPTSLLLLFVGATALRRYGLGTAFWLQSFLVACAVHALVDILTHHDDGPLLFWPFHWQTRFRSPVSYWDHRHYGSEVAVLELALVLGLLGYVLWHWLRRRIAGGARPEG